MRIKQFIHLLLILSISSASPVYKTIDPSPGPQPKITVTAVFNGVTDYYIPQLLLPDIISISSTLPFVFELIPTDISIDDKQDVIPKSRIFFHKTARRAPPVVS